MLKPTSKLNVQIIEFLTKNEEIKELLNERDHHKKAIGVELHCRFRGKDPSDNKISRYVVDFVYRTEDNFNESDDDIRVFLEVLDKHPVEMKIVKIKKY